MKPYFKEASNTFAWWITFFSIKMSATNDLFVLPIKYMPSLKKIQIRKWQVEKVEKKSNDLACS